MYGLFRYLIVLSFVMLFPLNKGYCARIKDISSIKGIRPNQIIGYGLVVGLNGTGDQSGTTFTIQSLSNMLRNMGIYVDPNDIKVKNVAAVIVSAFLPPFAKVGQKIDVTVSSIGDAKSLQGGTLLLTPLRGVDGKVYAIAQGPLSVGGFSVSGAAGGGVVKNHPTVARISGGATVEREIPFNFGDKKELTILLNHPDFVTAKRIADAINQVYNLGIAKAIDSGTISVKIPDEFHRDLVSFVSRLESIDIQPDAVAKVVVNEKTGTVVIGENVKISQVAISHGNLNIEVKEKKSVSQPSPFAPGAPQGGGTFQSQDNVLMAPGGQTVVTPQTDITIEEEKKKLIILPKSANIGDLVRALNAIGVTPRDLITILETLKAAGALQAEIVIM